VIALPQKNGKLEAKTVSDYLSDYYADESYDHMVFPGMVYISHPTEYGTLYTKKELTELSGVCHSYGIPLYLDGARLSYALMSNNTDVTLHDIAELCDVFYIGGTKCGALCGVAVVFTKHNKPKHFLTSVKKRGALLAKGRLPGVQFDALFTDDLYFRIGKHAIGLAEKLKKIFSDHGIKLFIESDTNQQFPVLENGMMKKLREKIDFCFWEKYDEDHTVVRFATCWSTSEADLQALEEALR
jgi:threonine aldolase